MSRGEYQDYETDFANTQSTTWLKVVVFVLVIAGIAFAGWQAFRNALTPEGTMTLIAKHRVLVTKARRVLPEELESKQLRSEHKSLYNTSLDLAAQLQKLPPPGGEEDTIRRDALADANSQLIELLELTPEELEKRLKRE